MIKTEKLGKLSISLGLILVVFLLMAFAFGTTANADELEDVEVVEATENAAIADIADAVKDAIPTVDKNSVADVVDTAKQGLSIKDVIDAIINGDDPIDNDFASKEGENYKGGPFHWYLLIENYQYLPDDIEITLWSDASTPQYKQTLTKANLLQRLGYIRIPAGVPVYITTNYDIDHWSMLKVTVEGAVIFDPATTLPGVIHNNHQEVYNDVCGINGFPVGGHILGLWIDLDDGDDGDADIGDDDDDDDDADIGDDDIGDDDDDGDADIGDDDDDDDDADIGDDDIGDDDADDDDDDNDGDDDADADADADADSDVDKDDDNPPKDPPKTGDTRDYMLVTIVAISSLVVLASTYRKKREN